MQYLPGDTLIRAMSDNPNTKKDSCVNNYKTNKLSYTHLMAINVIFTGIRQTVIPHDPIGLHYITVSI